MFSFFIQFPLRSLAFLGGATLLAPVLLPVAVPLLKPLVRSLTTFYLEMADEAAHVVAEHQKEQGNRRTKAGRLEKQLETGAEKVVEGVISEGLV